MLKPFGLKAARFIRRHPHDDAFVNILVGAVRSSKTYAVNAKLVSRLAPTEPGKNDGWWPGGTGLITGKSKTSIKTNVLNDVFTLAGRRNYHYNSSSGELTLFNRPFIVVGAADESRYAVIKGMTAGLWIGDEATLYPKSFFDMAVSRMSLRWARAYLTTNPADPYHYIKKEWLDSEEKMGRRDIWYDNFTLDDNPNIDQEKKEQLKRSFSGVFYRRNILGEWCIAEGAIYRDVLTDDIYYGHPQNPALDGEFGRPPGLQTRGGHMQHTVAIDYGTQNPCVFLDIFDDGVTLWIDREYYWDGRAMMRQKTDREYGADLIEFINGRDPLQPAVPRPPDIDQRLWPGVVLDPSALSFRAELISRGVLIQNGDNEVLDGIRKVAVMLNRKRIRIHRRCRNTIQEMMTYAWDEKRAENGLEQPVKKNDHCPDALRYKVETHISEYRLAA
jgi:PBSX family phage terminase large subunit